MIGPEILAAVGLSFFAAVAFRLAVAYAAFWVASLFTQKKKQKLPEVSTYPVQGAMKAIPIPKTYGTDRVAGNIIWFGELHPYHIKHDSGGGGKGGGGDQGAVYETRYRRSFLICVGEGPAQVLRAWKGKDEIEVTEFTWLDGDNNTGVSDLTGEDYGEYKNNAMAFFDEYELGNSQSLPNFSFEISTVSGYQYTIFSDVGGIWMIPLTSKFTTLTLDADGQAVDYGGGIVGLPCSGNPFQAGDIIYIEGSSLYDGARTLTAGTTTAEIRFTRIPFVAETFDGTETVIKNIAINSATTGAMAQDSTNNLYFGHQWDNGTYITKVTTAGALVYDFFSSSNWPVGIEVVTSVDIAGGYLYICWEDHAGKYDLSSGAEIWFILTSYSAHLDADVDSDGNYYIGSSVADNVFKLSAATGSSYEMTLMGQAKSPYINDYGAYELIVDNDLGLVINGAWQATLTSKGPGIINLMYNLSVRTFDDSAGDQIAVGTNVVSGSTTQTRVISKGWIASNGSHIFVMVAGDAGREIHKYSWDGSSLTEVDSATIAATSANIIYFDPYGNLVVTNQGSGEAVVGFWYYDTDLNYLGRVDNFPATVFSSTYAFNWIKPEAAFYPQAGYGTNDVNPADVIQDLLTHERYGARISTEYINQTTIDDCWTYWQNNNMLISITIDDSRPWKDWVDYILSHCGGYRYLSAGQLCLGVLKSEDAVDNILADDIVQPNPDAENLPAKVQITKRPYSDTYNRIEISWQDRNSKYDLSVAIAYDAVDLSRSGTPRKKSIKLLGIKNSAFAQKMAYRFLIDTLYRFSIYKFTVGYSKQLLECGDVITITDDQLLSAEKVRIMSISEDVHGRGLNITAMDDLAEHYPVITYSSQESLFTEPDAVTLADGTAYFREDTGSASICLSIVPGNAYANGWYVYFSYDDSSYELAGRCGIGGITGGDANSAGTITESLAGHGSMTWRPDESVLVSIGTLTDLPTTVTDDAFWSDRNLARIGSEIIAYKTAEETATEGIWRISNLRRGLFGTEPAAHSPGEAFVTLVRDFTYQFDPADIGRTVYFKILTFYGTKYQNVADVTGQAYTIQGYHLRPYPASLLRLTSDQNDGGSGDYSGSSFTLYWNLPGKDSGYNVGGYDVAGAGVPYGNYVADSELQAIRLKFEQPAGTAIGQREVAATATSATITKATDLGGNNPAVVRVVPRRSLESRLQNKLTVDDGS